MMASRGMGAIAPSKMPKAKTITRKDDPENVTAYKKGGAVKPRKLGTGGLPEFDPEAAFVGNEGVGQLDDYTLRSNITKEAQSGANPARLKALQAEEQKRSTRFQKYKLAAGGKTGGKKGR